MPIRLAAALALGMLLLAGSSLARTAHGPHTPQMPRAHMTHHTGHHSTGRRMHGY